MTVTGSWRSNWVNWKGEEQSCEGEGEGEETSLLDSGRQGVGWLAAFAFAFAVPGWACQMTARSEIFLRWCKESVASSVENGEGFDSIWINREGVCLAMDGPRTVLRPGGRAASQSQCGAVQCGCSGRGGGWWERQGARRLLTKRRGDTRGLAGWVVQGRAA